MNLEQIYTGLKNRLNRYIVTGKKVTLGNDAYIQKAPKIGCGTSITIGHHFEIKYSRLQCELGAAPWSKLDIGHHVFINEGVNIFAMHSITIGDYTKIGDCVAIHDCNFHEVEEGAGVKTMPIVIGRNVWIGRNSIILPGVSIGDNSVVGAGSVVTKSFPANCVIGGNPAKLIRTIKASPTYIRG
jgi:acetyltransferase-like isoleucine patch superfamily enzyme